VLERPGVMASFRRSRELVRGNEMQVFAVLLVLALVLAVAWFILGSIFGGATRGAILSGLGQLIANTITAPLLALAAPTIYFQLRQLKDGAGAAPAAVGSAPTGAAAPGGAGGGSPLPPEPAAPPQSPPPGPASTTPEAPTRRGPAEPPPPAAGSTESPGPEAPSRPSTG